MIQQLLELDNELFLVLNNAGGGFMDPTMIFFTNLKVWYPLYFIIIVSIIFKYKTKGLYIILALIIAVALADQICSGLLKPLIGRLRPCHELGLVGKFRLLVPCGGKYSFCSSHAGTSFALASSIYFIFGQKKWFSLFFIWAFFVAYSRVYVGVHYPLDIFCGTLIGILSGFLVFLSLKRVISIENE